MGNVRKWQKVTAPASWAGRQVVPNGIRHQIDFDENSVGWVLVEEAGEPVGRHEQDGVGPGTVFVSAIEIADRVKDITVHSEFRTTGEPEKPAKKPAAKKGAKK